MEILSLINSMGRELIHFRMEMFIVVNSKKMFSMVLEDILMSEIHFMKDSGTKGVKKVKEN